jgi:hypothetical protein
VESEAFKRLVEVMAAIATGDRAAPFTLYTEFGGAVANQMRSHLRSVGVGVVSANDLDGLVIDACLALGDCGRAWSPDGGALPWTWARARLRGIAVDWVGQHAAEFVDSSAVLDARGVCEVAVDDADELEVLARLAAVDAACALLEEALERVASERDRKVVLELRVQADAGDPSPAHTVGPRHGLSPDATRQVASRVCRRLRQLAATDAHFAPLTRTSLVA